MSIFSEKLSRLAETISLVGDRGARDIAEAIASGRGRLAIAIGSGGSMVVAEYFARCRTTLGLGQTLVMTPMQLALSMAEWDGIDVWLFSAGANNPDISAAFQGAVASADATHLVTTRADGATAIAAAAHSRAQVFVLPVADPKDGFLATHSMISMVTGLLLASDLTTERPHGAELAAIYLNLSRSAVANGVDEVASFQPGDTMVIVHDPQVAAVATLIETSMWETGIAPVQRTDFRNFAHGRHVWAARHPTTMFTLALTTCESEAVWQPIRSALPLEVRGGGLAVGHGGRLANAVGIVRGLAIVGHLGGIAGVDPGRPGRGDFAEAIYDDDALQDLVTNLTPAVRHKATARLLHDPVDDGEVSLCAIGRDRLRELGDASFVGLALDYDGTVVPNQPTEARLGPPSKEVMDELVRLVDDGVQVGFATGRGGSAGEKLREALPERIHQLVLMGYYNGAHVRPLDVDISEDRPMPDEHVASVARWIANSGLLLDGVALKVREVQVTVNHSDVVDVASFAQRLAICPQVANGSVRVLSSHHSFDVVPRGTTKLKVVEALAGRAGRPGASVLGVGDSGSPLGNDRELLSGPHGVSVDSVCGSHLGTWTLFGSRLRGPDALSRILRSARVDGGVMSIDLGSLDLDRC
ncbi:MULTISPECIES: HAD family hydrolase [unclassified Sphingomonas]|uniref:HAD family hydrolase n=1 Tax=unclassified Sphingomonas TaxID=196159 RepID=UPI002150AB78|nr:MULTISPECIES: HAD hydrolase family protein [unclassified Sphingomonas]MCR5870903.1 HAD hydrolase family protein [Sphingomonas sp. J344]UUY00778.1 HAD hydrolase family protein [Sphingomonas sp. J315]